MEFVIYFIIFMYILYKVVDSVETDILKKFERRSDYLIDRIEYLEQQLKEIKKDIPRKSFSFIE